MTDNISNQFKNGDAVFIGSFIEAEQMTGQQLRPYTKRKKVIKEGCALAVWVENGEVVWATAKEYFAIHPLGTKAVIGKSIYEDMENERNKLKSNIKRANRSSEKTSDKITDTTNGNGHGVE